MPDHLAQKRYPPELRERAVRMVLEAIDEQGGERFGVITRIARQLGIGTESLRNWVNQAEIDRGARVGTTTEDRARIAKLEKEARELRRANEMADPTGERTGPVNFRVSRSQERRRAGHPHPNRSSSPSVSALAGGGSSTSPATSVALRRWLG